MPGPVPASTRRPSTARTCAPRRDLLATAVASIVGKKEERAVASLFTPGGTHAMKGEFQGINDFEVVAFLVVLPGGGANELSPRLSTPLPCRRCRVDQRVPKKLLLEHGAPRPPTSAISTMASRK